MVSVNEFHISKNVRLQCDFDGTLFSSTGNVIFANMKNVRNFAVKLNALFDKTGEDNKKLSAGQLNAMGLLDEIFHYACMQYRRDKHADTFKEFLSLIVKEIGEAETDRLLLDFMDEFPPTAVFQGAMSAEEYLNETCLDAGTGDLRTNREQTLEEMILLCLANENPAFKPFEILFSDKSLAKNKNYKKAWKIIKAHAATLPHFGPFDHDLINFLKEPVLFSPNSLKGQLEYIEKHWATMIGQWIKRLLAGMDTITEEEKAMWQPLGGGGAWDGPDMAPYSYENLMNEYERFSPDKDWMPKVVLMAKTVLVWLDQLTKKYGYPITRLDQIPDAELDALRDEGFTGLWLIGLWERSSASKRVKQICGNPEAAASAYSLFDYNIASNIGGWDALGNLRTRLWQRGIRLASDMVPNHTGMDGDWVMNHPDRFIQRRDNPFPQYTFTGENLSHDGRTSIYLEDHYYSKNDCAVVFKRVDNQTGDTRYIYHGNDGTGLPWNDTAQIDFLNPEAREAVIQEILHVARNFPIIRFDAAMVLAKKSIRRLWYPEPGHGGDIATRSETGLSTEQFNDAIPNEFWREVVDRVATEVPDTLLLAEAFWMMEGYFVRTLGMHRVYNSAFMNMLKKEENQKYRDTVKNTILFDPQVLKRFVNFMNNPDEETAVAQFGKGDKYFGVCTLMITMPGLPMFGHGQIEGFEEKYGMEYTKAYKNETPDNYLVDRHWHDIFPLMHKRHIFANVENFLFYDLWENGTANENVYAYSNSDGNEKAVVFYNNKYERAQGWIKQSVPYAVKTGNGDEIVQITRSISEGLGLTAEEDKFCIFREHKSGLWFIRKSREICEKGLYVSLNGFESQVLMDVQQITDLPDGRYRTLCEMLNGRGCENLEVAYQEMVYADLYKSLFAFAETTLPKMMELSGLSKLETVESLSKGKKPVSGKVKTKVPAKDFKALFESSKNTAISFYRTANSFAAFKKETEPAKLEKAFETKAKKTIQLILEAGKKPEDLQKALLKAKTAKDFIVLSKNSMTALSEALLCQTLVAPYLRNGLSEKWGLERKFSEFFRIESLSKKDVRQTLKKVFLFCENAGNLKFTEKDVKTTAYKIVTLLTSGKQSWELSGANEFDHIFWFNKEKLDENLALYFAVILLEKEKQETNVLSLYKKLCTAKEKAGYKCAEFARPFAPKEKAVSKKKTVSKGKTASKSKAKAKAKSVTKKKTK
ncbi:MAG: alpha-amylase family glycosyl hydrolase [Treponema sp.]|nr:alpha-amylase family glycosyl hydrolase [Treponema sp.]